METSTSRRICVKIKNLREIYHKDMNLKKWLDDENNLYCGRSGRIFINGEYFAYKGSKWSNPYTLKKYSINESLKLYEEYIINKIKEDNDYNLNELKNKNLGCWCNPHEKCHVDILINLLNFKN